MAQGKDACKGKNSLASLLFIWQVGHMKKALINFKADPADIDRWKAALERDGRTMSEVCRQSLDRIAKRIEKQAGQQ